MSSRTPPNARESPTGEAPKPTQPHHAAEYAKFLQLYFYEEPMRTRLAIPSALLQSQIQNKSWMGAELRDHRKQLVGIVFSVDTGSLTVQNKPEPTGMITWLCVHPVWRKKGVTNILLRAVYVFAQPRRIQWYRNDGFTVPPTPPVLFQMRLARKKNRHLPGSPSVSRIPSTELAKYTPYFRNSFTLTLQAIPTSNPLVELWKKPTSQGEFLILIAPTFEQTDGLHHCEVLAWACTNSATNDYEQSLAVETILQSIPYGFAEAPSSIPHADDQQMGWQRIAPSQWCVFGLDPGYPSPSKILPWVYA